MIKANNLVLCFHKGGSKKRLRLFIQNIILKWTKGKFCHVELYNPKTGLSFSSRGYKRGDIGRGVSWANLTYSHPERWDTVILPIRGHKETEVLIRANSIIGCKYDLRGAMRKDKAGKGRSKGRFFCSEAIAFALGINPNNIWPDELWDKFH